MYIISIYKGHYGENDLHTKNGFSVMVYLIIKRVNFIINT